MDTPTMVYKKGGKLKVDGEFYSYDIVEATPFDGKPSELGGALDKGWFKTPLEALAGQVKTSPKPSPDDATPTREELEEQAKALGIKFGGRTSDETLTKKIQTGG